MTTTTTPSPTLEQRVLDATTGALELFGIYLGTRLGLYAAVTRQYRDGTPAAGWFPEERITMAQAVEYYTLGSAYAEFADDRKGSISEGKLEDVPPYFHYCAAWALVHGAVALYHSPFWSNVLEDQEGFFQFLMDIGVRMGNKRKHSGELPGAEPKTGETPAT